MSKYNDPIGIWKQWKSANRDSETNEWWLTTAVSKGTKITLDMTDNQEIKTKITVVLIFPKVFIYAVSLLNDLMKILVGLNTFYHVTFKDLEFDCYCRNNISQ